MTSVLLTVDTELWLAGYQRGMPLAENFDRVIMGRAADGEWGVGYQARKLAEHGVRAAFLVEALSAGVFGLDVLKRTLDPILSWGHVAELHLHTEWLAWFAKDPVDGRRGRSMCNFSASDQKLLLEMGIENLTRAGAPVPRGFRAGNYGANNDTLRLLAQIGLEYDTSYNLPYLGDTCRIAVDRPLFDSETIEGLVELPVSCFEDYPGHFRHAQLCAISSSEMKFLIEESSTRARSSAVIVSHSFELLNPKRTRSNPIVVRRFEHLCAYLQSSGSRHWGENQRGHPIASVPASASSKNPLRSSSGRTAWRMAEQAVSSVLFR